MQQRYGGRGLVIVAINVDTKREDVERFLRQYPAEFTVAYDGTGGTPGAYGVKVMPSSTSSTARQDRRESSPASLTSAAPKLEARIRALLEIR